MLRDQLLDLGVEPGGVLVVHTSFSKLRAGRGRAGGVDRGVARGARGGRDTGDAEHERRRRARVRSGDHAVRRHGHRRRDVLAAAGRPAQRQPARVRRGGAGGGGDHGPAPGRRAARAEQPARPRPRTRRPGAAARRRPRREHRPSTWPRSWRPSATGCRSGRWSCATASRSATTTTRSTTAASASRWSTAGWTRSSLQRRGVVGNAEARLARARDIVRVVIARLRQDETAFLHPPGVDVECDAARASLERRR